MAVCASCGRENRARASQGIAKQDPKHGFMQALEAALRLGDRAKAEELLAVVEEQPVGLRSPLLVANGHRARARLAGEDPGADRHFSAAEVGLRALALPFFDAVAPGAPAEEVLA